MLSWERGKIFEGHSTSPHGTRNAAYRLLPDGYTMPYKLGMLCKEKLQKAGAGGGGGGWWLC